MKVSNQIRDPTVLSPAKNRGTPEAVWGYVKLCEAMWNYVRLCEAMWGCVKLCEAVWSYVKLCEAM